MAFKPNEAVAPAATNDAWKAQGFLNIYLPSKIAGERKKLGAIPLKDSKPNEKELMAWLTEDPARISVLMSKLIVEYQPAAQAPGSGFDLSD